MSLNVFLYPFIPFNGKIACIIFSDPLKCLRSVLMMEKSNE